MTQICEYQVPENKVPDDQASQESNSAVILTPESSSRAASPPPVNTQHRDSQDSATPAPAIASNAADINFFSRADIDLWSADIADLTMRLARYDEYNPPSVQPETRDGQIERAQGMYYYRKCQELTNLLRRSQQLLRDSTSESSTDPGVISAISEQRWAEEQMRGKLERALDRAQDLLCEEKERTETLSIYLREEARECTALEDQLKDQVELNGHLDEDIARLKDGAGEAEALIEELSAALRAQNWALRTMVQEVETMRDGHHQMLDDIVEAFDMDHQTGTEIVEGWGPLVTELLLRICRFDADAGSVTELLNRADNRQATGR